MGNKRPRPTRLAQKLLSIRQHLRLSQSKMAILLNLDMYHRVSEYERGRREPTLIVLLRYARAANVSVEAMIDDEMDLPFYDTEAIATEQDTSRVHT
jgi:transcriptional regulator with XRE-family HTH domain